MDGLSIIVAWPGKARHGTARQGKDSKHRRRLKVCCVIGKARRGSEWPGRARQGFIVLKWTYKKIGEKHGRVKT